MMDSLPKPLRIIKNPPSTSFMSASSPNSSYRLPIPRRSSSLRIQSLDDSGSSMTSTIAPMEVGSERLQVYKTRTVKTAVPLSTDRTLPLAPHIPHTLEPVVEDKRRTKSDPVSRFFHALKSRSRSSGSNKPSFKERNDNAEYSTQPGALAYATVSPMAMEPEDTPKGRTTEPNQHQILHAHHSKCEMSMGIFSPLIAPITTIDMKITTESPRIEDKELLIWAAVEVSADAQINELITPGRMIPLDVVIILDNSQGSSFNALKQAAQKAFIVASTLDFRFDRFSIGCADEEGDLKILLSLASHPLDVVKRIIDSFPLASTRYKPNAYGLEKAILQASDLLVRQCNTTALCQIFLITGSTSTVLSLPTIDGRVRIHTISPDPRFFLLGSTAPGRWHISSNPNRASLRLNEACLVDEIRRVSAHLHTGIDCGILTDLRLCLVSGEGCQIEYISGETHCASLRPGEKWTLWAKVRVPAGPAKRIMTHKDCTGGADTDIGSQYQTVDELIGQLQQMLNDHREECAQTIMTAFLGYRHSLLPKSNTIRVSECCQVIRSLRRDSGCDVGHKSGWYE